MDNLQAQMDELTVELENMKKAEEVRKTAIFEANVISMRAAYYPNFYLTLHAFISYQTPTLSQLFFQTEFLVS